VKALMFCLFADKVFVGKERKMKMYGTRVIRVLGENLKPPNYFPFVFRSFSASIQISNWSLTFLIVSLSDHFREEPARDLQVPLPRFLSIRIYILYIYIHACDLIAEFCGNVCVQREFAMRKRTSIWRSTRTLMCRIYR
jgi:hypothetical protein